MTSEHPEPEQGASVDDIEADIERTREDLGDTVDALTDRLNVKAQAKRKAEEAKAKATSFAEHAKDAGTTDDGRPDPKVLAGAGAVVAVVVVVVVVLIRRRSR